MNIVKSALQTAEKFYSEHKIIVSTGVIGTPTVGIVSYIYRTSIFEGMQSIGKFCISQKWPLATTVFVSGVIGAGYLFRTSIYKASKSALTFFSAHSRELGSALVLPLCVAIAYIPENPWKLDPYSNLTGKCVATILNTSCYLLSHLMIQELWSRYCNKKNQESLKEISKKLKLEKIAGESYQAELELETIRANIKRAKHQLDHKTIGEELLVAKLQKAAVSKLAENQTALKNKRDFIDNLIGVVAKIPKDVYPDITEVERLLNEEKIEAKETQIKIIKEKLEHILRDAQAYIEIRDKVIRENSDKRKEESNALRKAKEELLQHEDAQRKNNIAKTENIVSLDREKKDLENLREQIRTLESQFSEKEYEDSKTAYEQTELEYQLLEAKVKELELGKVKESIIDKRILDLENLKTESTRQLLAMQKGVQEDLPKATDNLKRAEIELAEAKDSFIRKLKEYLNEITRNLNNWKGGLNQKKLELENKKKEALEENKYQPQGVLRGIVSNLGLQSRLPKIPPEIRAGEIKINQYFGMIEEIIESVNLLNDAQIDVEFAFSCSFPIHIPAWSNEGRDSEQLIETLRSQVGKLKLDDDILFNLKGKLEILNNAKDFSEEILSPIYNIFSRYYGLIPKNLQEDYIRFKKSVQNYFLHSNKLSSLTKQEEMIRGEVNSRGKQKEDSKRSLAYLANNLTNRKQAYGAQAEKFKMLATRKELLLSKVADQEQVVANLEASTKVLVTKDAQYFENIRYLNAKIRELDSGIKSRDDLIQQTQIEVKGFETLKMAIDRLITPGGAVPLLDLLQQRHNDYVETEKAYEKAELSYSTRNQLLINNQRKSRENLIINEKERTAKKAELSALEDQLKEAEKKLGDEEKKQAYLSAHLLAQEKSQAALDYYNLKLQHLNEVIANDLKVQRLEIEMHQKRIDLALKKQTIHLKRDRLGDLQMAEETKLVDQARYKLVAAEWEKYKLDQAWKKEGNSNRASRIQAILRVIAKEEEALFHFYSNKIKLSRSSENNAKIKNKYLNKALFDVIDLVLDRIYLEVKRNGELDVDASFDLVQVLSDWIQDSPVLQALKNEMQEEPVQLPLIKALELDKVAHTDKSKPPAFSIFSNRMAEITYNKYPKIHDRKIPHILAKLELIKHLMKKPLKASGEGNIDTEKYIEDKKKYRKVKLEIRKTLQKSEFEYVEYKQAIKDYKAKANIVKKNRDKIDNIVQLYFFDKLAYLVPAVGVLYLNYRLYTSALLTNILSEQTAKMVWTITTVAYLYLFGSLPKHQLLTEKVAANS